MSKVKHVIIVTILVLSCVAGFGIDAWSTIQAEAYNGMSGIQFENNNTTIGYIDANDWVRYDNVVFGNNSAASVTFRIASANNGKKLLLRLDSTGGTIIGTLTVASTGGWTTWKTQTITVTGATGTHALFLVADAAAGSGVCNLDYFSFAPGTTAAPTADPTADPPTAEPTAVPTAAGVSAWSIIEAESFGGMSGIQLENSNTTVGYIDANDWVRYDNIDFGSVGASSVTFKLASANSGKNLLLRVDSVSGTVIGTLTVAGTGSWTTWTTQSTPITAVVTGVRSLYLVADAAAGSGVCNLDYFTFFDGGTAVPTAVPTEAPTSIPGAGGVVSRYGDLQVLNKGGNYGNTLCDASGNPVQLKGFSMLDLMAGDTAWVPGATIPNMKAFMPKMSGVRLAMYTSSYMSQNDSGKQNYRTRVKALIADAIAQDIYVMVDWHILNDGDPWSTTYRNASIAFFQDIASNYGNYNNVIFELCNEPKAVSYTGTIKPYAEAVLAAIRVYSDNVAVVGTPNWSQDVDNVVGNAISTNLGRGVLYSLHFYAASHYDSLRAKGDKALNGGVAVMLSEWGTVDASGNGSIDLNNSGTWLSWAASRNVSWFNWSWSIRNESSAALSTWSSLSGPWSDSNLTTSGAWVRGKIQE